MTAKTQDSFLPEGYTAPVSSGEKFVKFEDGETKLRILSKPVVGWTYFRAWLEKSAKVTSRTELKNVTDWAMDKFGNKSTPKHFWAMVVWNYNTESLRMVVIVIQVLVLHYHLLLL